MEIVWTNRAHYSFDSNIAYLIDEWSIAVAQHFIGKVEDAEKQLLQNPHLGRFDEELRINKLLIVRQIYLFYEIYEHQIVWIDFWNNYKNPYWL